VVIGKVVSRLYDGGMSKTLLNILKACAKKLRSMLGVLSRVA
jgi:hypothetical protein